jgi:serine/threonine protein kinase
MRGILSKVFRGVAELHNIGVMHRDLKPSNTLININSHGGTAIVLSDFSSSVSQAAFESELYGPDNVRTQFPHTDSTSPAHGEFYPSKDEETPDYSPPEVILCRDEEENSSRCAYDDKLPFAYDSWSLGVLFLEMILGTANIFVSDQRTTAMIQHRMKKLESKSNKLNKFKKESTARSIHDLSYRAALSEFCIVEPSDLEDEFSVVPLVPLCSIHNLASAILRRDPLGTGFQDLDGLDLISKLLKWDPKEVFRCLLVLLLS